MRDFFETFYNALLWFILILCLFILGSGLYQRFFSGDGRTGFFGIGYAVVVSGSMEPELKKDDMIIYRAHDFSDYAVGDIIVYAKEDNEDSAIVTHRIVEIGADTVITKGDANAVADDPVQKEKIVGRVVFMIPQAGVVVDFVRSKEGCFVIVSLVIILLITGIFIRGRKKKRHQVNTAMGEQIIKY